MKNKRQQSERRKRHISISFVITILLLSVIPETVFARYTSGSSSGGALTYRKCVKVANILYNKEKEVCDKPENGMTCKAKSYERSRE